MPNMKNIEINKKILPVIYVLDTSGSMYGSPIASLNDAMRESQKILQDRATELTQCEIQIGVLTFSNGASWQKDHLISLEDFYWNDVDAEGMTDLGAAIDELNKKLRAQGGMLSRDNCGYYPPVLIFMSDGQPTDDWKKAFDTAFNNNGYFHVARKVCIAFGEAENYMDVFYGLAGREGVIMAKDLSKLEKYIVAVTKSIPKLGQSHLAEDDTNIADLAKAEAENMGVDTSDNNHQSQGAQGSTGGSQSIEDVFNNPLWSI